MSNLLTECFVGLKSNVNEQVLFRNVVIENITLNLIRRNTKGIKILQGERNSKQEETLLTQEEKGGMFLIDSLYL